MEVQKVKVSVRKAKDAEGDSDNVSLKGYIIV